MLKPFSFLLLTLFISLSQEQLIGAPQLDCRRVHPSFCCTSRIRSLCPNECAAVPCGPEYYQRLFSTDLNSGSSARDGNAAPRVVTGESVVLEEKPEDTAVVVDVTTARPTISTFPTLIPFEPNIDEIPTQDKDVVWTTPPAPLPQPQPQNPQLPPQPVTQPPKKNKTPDPRIIRPPDASLVLIGDYDDGDDSLPTEQTPVSNSGVVTVPSAFISREEFVNQETLSRTIPDSPQTKDQTWSVGFARNREAAKGIEGPSFAVDGIAGKKKPTRGINSLLGQFKLTPSQESRGEGKTAPEFQSGSAVVGKHEFLPFRPTPPSPQGWQQPHPSWETPPPAATWEQTPPPAWQQPPPPSSWQAQTPPPPPPPPVWQRPPPPPPPQPVWMQTPPPQTCGVAPSFTPCVSAQEASSKLLACCRQKNLPPGCQSLCRYDITQAEVRAALDRGQCGLLHVAPFLECAAQGKDNSECCQVRGVAQKSGPQCLQFCRPQGGLTSLGLQHVVCGNAIGEMLQCHHSGIRR